MRQKQKREVHCNKCLDEKMRNISKITPQGARKIRTNSPNLADGRKQQILEQN